MSTFERVAEIERMTQALHVVFLIYGIVVRMSTPHFTFFLSFFVFLLASLYHK